MPTSPRFSAARATSAAVVWTLAVALLAAATAITAPVAALAADYYVSPGGNNAGDGLSPATAWATLQHAANTVAAGDTAHVADGGYQGFDLRTSGTALSPITFIADGPAVEITSDNPVTPDGINVENAAHVVIDGFTVDGRTRAGIRAAVSQFITVRNCHTGFNGRWGIFTGFVDDVVIEDDETYGSIAEHGIYVSNSGDRPVIRRNLVHDNHANGIHMNGDASQGGDGLISDALVERNVIYGNGAGGGSGINMDGVTDSVVRNNLLYDNHASGISLYRIDGATGSKNNVVVNNTVINASDARWCININNGSTGNHVTNNILYDAHSFRGVITIDASSLSGFVADYNGVMDRFSVDDGNTVIDLSDWQALGYGAHSFLATPADHFVTPGSDFHLLVTSPAIDAGTAVDAPADDLDGNPRPVGGGYDVGAYEAQLLACGDGGIDPGEECGEPGLPTCADPCTSCSQCICAADEPVCGDALVCGNEECEQDADCSGGLVCIDCGCRNPPACTSGITIDKPGLSLRADPFVLNLKGRAVVPKPWTGVDPVAGGIRIIVDSTAGSGGFDVTLPGGASWTVNAAGTRWKYKDPSGSAGGIQKAIVKNRSKAEDGRLQWVVKGKGGAVVLPPADDVRTAIILGDPGECAALVWNGPDGPKPRCKGDASRLRCK